jgi:hypothetical protein
MLSSIVTFPLEQVGALLREMSLSGTGGNLAAIILYAAIALLPIGVWFFLRKKGWETKADVMLFLLSGTLFYVLYYSVNPGLFETKLPGSEGLYLSAIFYSVLVSYGVIRIQTMAAKGSKKTLFSLMKFFLWMLAAVFAVMAIVEFAITFPKALEETKKAYDEMAAFAAFTETTVSVHPEVMSVVTLMESIMRGVPYLLNIIIIFWSVKMIRELNKDWFSKESVAAANKLADGTGRVLGITVVLELLYNVLLFFGRNHLAVTRFTIHIPLVPILFMMAMVLIARYIRASQQLKEENELFI